jgi:hypothetical protein
MYYVPKKRYAGRDRRICILAMVSFVVEPAVNVA